MPRLVALVSFAAVATVGTLQACTEGPGREDVAIQRLQTLLCEKAQACGCGPLDYDVNGEPLACGEWSPASDNADASRAFDPGCVERWAALVEDLSCGAAAIPSYAQLCPLYHGSLREGTSCDDGYLLTQTACGRGLLCIAGTCRDPQRTRFGGQHEPCDLAERCNDGLVCAGDQVCMRVPSAGEPCLYGYLCNRESYCDTEICVELPGPGQRCDGGQCRPGSFCSNSNAEGPECRATGDVGALCQGHDECLSRNCPAGVCQAPAVDGDPCGSQLPCGPGLVCNDGTCRGGTTGTAAIPTCDLVDVL